MHILQFPCSKPQQKPSSSFFNRQPINRDYKLNETNLENKENLAQKENKLRMRIVTEVGRMTNIYI